MTLTGYSGRWLTDRTTRLDVCRMLKRRGQRIYGWKMAPKDHRRRGKVAVVQHRSVDLCASLPLGQYGESFISKDQLTSAEFVHGKGIRQQALAASYHAAPSSIAIEAALISEILQSC